MERSGWGLSTKVLELNEQRQQEIAVLFLVARGYPRLLAKTHISCPKVRSVFVFCLVFRLTMITTAAGRSRWDSTDFTLQGQRLGEGLLDLFSPGSSVFKALIFQSPGYFLSVLLPPKTQHIRNELCSSFPGFPPQSLSFPTFVISAVTPASHWLPPVPSECLFNIHGNLSSDQSSVAMATAPPAPRRSPTTLTHSLS